MSRTRILIVWLAASAFALAGEVAAAEPSPPKSEVPLVLTIEEKVSTLWDDTRTALSSFFSMFVPPSPLELANRIDSPDSEFWSLLSDAGYQVKEIESSVGVVPEVSATFQVMREMSDSDREFLERRLDSHARRDGGLTARLQRLIVNVILEASESGHYRIEKLEVVLLPLPKARFVLTPVEGVRDIHQQAILHAIDQLKKKSN